jgi:aryl-alcohol dehydrogenase-like predicted oxidoreductase
MANVTIQTRTTSRLPYDLSVIGLGTWQLGGDWGQVAAGTATEILSASADAGVSVFDTADVYGDGRSEQTIGAFLKQRQTGTSDRPAVFTKMGRRMDQVEQNYVLANFREWIDRSRRNLGVETLDLVQLHCPPTSVFSSDEVFDALDTLVAEQCIAAYGVSVETCDEALASIARPGVASVQIILNAFRQKPLDEVLPAAARAGVAIIARVPLASGLLSGRFNRSTTFSPDDHRQYNRHGEAFDVGETFAGVPYETGVDAAVRFSAIAAEAGISPAHLALRWIIDQPGVTTVIPGASTLEQARANAGAADVVPISQAARTAIKDLYDEQIRPLVHDRW